MIFGIGTDLVSIARIAQVLDRQGAAFAKRVLSPNEFAQFNGASDQAAWLAKRWAAKEAFGKAAGLGIRAPLSLSGIGVANDAHGKPIFALSEPIHAWMHERGIAQAHLSLSDEKAHALAFVVLET